MVRLYCGQDSVVLRKNVLDLQTTGMKDARNTRLSEKAGYKSIYLV